MKIHHLNAATMCPYGGRLITGDAPENPSGGTWTQLRAPARLVCHCLLVETERGLVLVETGIGLDAMRDAASRLGREFVTVARPTLDESEAAVSQIEALGFRASDVRHILVTHLDLDHAGGLPDFPDAEVHIYELEHQAAMQRASTPDKKRYRPAHWAHGAKFRPLPTGGERWFGFDCVRDIPGLPPEILLVPVVGHSRGHCAVAVDAGDRWLLHAGDAYFHRGEMSASGRVCTPGLAAFQRLVAFDDAARRRNQERLRRLAVDHASEVCVFSAHDGVEYDALAGAG